MNKHPQQQQAYIAVFQSHCFDDALRPTNHKNKGKSAAHKKKADSSPKV